MYVKHLKYSYVWEQEYFNRYAPKYVEYDKLFIKVKKYRNNYIFIITFFKPILLIFLL